MDTGTATDEVTDLIASIEMQRQETEKEAGSATACGAALRSLQELLDREKEALRLDGPNTEHAANIAAVTIGIGKVTRLAGLTSGRLSLPERAHLGQREEPRRGPLRSPSNPSRSRGRRTMGRGSGR